MQIIILCSIIAFANSLRYAAFPTDSSNSYSFAVNLDFIPLPTLVLQNPYDYDNQFYMGSFIEIIEYKEVGTINGYTPGL